MTADTSGTFPRQPVPGTITGTQPKLLLRRIGDQFVSGLTEHELLARYEMCEDLAQQLMSHTRRKMAENPVRLLDETPSKVSVGVARKVQSGQWDDLSSDELHWLENVFSS